MLQYDAVATAHRWDDHPDDLPDRKIPGHDRQYCPQRLMHVHRLSHACDGRHIHRLEESIHMLRKIVAQTRAFQYLDIETEEMIMFLRCLCI